jgi:Tol biopolymer transport system component
MLRKTLGPLWCALACCVLVVLPAGRGLGAPFVESRNAQCVAFSPDGKLVATGVSGQSNGQFPPRPHPRPRKSGVVVLWDVASGELVHRVETFGDLTKVRFSPDGSKLAYSRLFETDDGVALNEVRVWDVKTGRTLHTFDRCYGFAFAPDGKTIAVLSRSRCNVFDTTDWTKRGEVKPLGKSVSIVFSPDGKQLAGIGREGEAYFIRLCDVAGGRELRKSTGFKKPFYTIVFSPGGQSIASGHAGGNVLVWNTADVGRRRSEQGRRGDVEPLDRQRGPPLHAQARLVSHLQPPQSRRDPPPRIRPDPLRLLSRRRIFPSRLPRQHPTAGQHRAGRRAVWGLRNSCVC